MANEGGLRRADFGRITIRADHTVVELPELDGAVLKRLRDTRISGKLIEIRPDAGPARRRQAPRRA
ncbi:MAG: DbpA RNA binding domain-containing protein [Nocardioides sp.]